MTLELSTETLRQVRALTEGIGFSNVSDRTRIAITGSDRVAFLNGFCTNDVKSLAVGGGCEAFLTNVKGKVLAHVFVFCDQVSLVLGGTPGQTQQILDHLDRYIIREDVRLRDGSHEGVQWLVGGKDAVELLARLTGDEISGALFSHANHNIAGCEVRVRRVPLLSSPAFLVACGVEDASAVRTALAEGGAVECGAEAVEVARVEAGFPRYGRDITEDNLPQEVNRDAQAISFKKGCYLGQETVARIDALGHVNQTLCGLRWEKTAAPSNGAPLVVQQLVVGKVTSTVWSPKVGAPLALAYLRREHTRPGARLETDLGVAEVVKLPV